MLTNPFVPPGRKANRKQSIDGLDQAEDNLDFDLAGWCTPAAGCMPLVKVNEFYEAHSYAIAGRECSSAMVKAN